MSTKEELLQDWLPRLWDALRDVRHNNNAAAEEKLYELYVEMKQQTLAEIQDVFGDITLEDQLSSMALELLSTKKRLAEVELVICQRAFEQPKREWVGLTNEEIEAKFKQCGGKWNGDQWVIEDADLHPFVRSIESTDIKTLKAISDEYNAWIRHHAAGHSYDDFLAKLREKNGGGQ